jgi:predicted Fe-S protein YdhL (DUF1289 family)
VKVCRIDEASGLCTGCLRSLQEIANWARYAPADRARIVRELPRRRARPGA